MAQNLWAINIEPILLELETLLSFPLPVAIRNDISRSSAVFILWTLKVDANPTTRDNCNWETAQAHAFNKPLYVFAERYTNLPMMIQYVTTYHTFDVFDQSQVKFAFDRAVDIAKEVAKKDAAAATYALFLGGLGLSLLTFACPNCGEEVDEAAPSCPKCGHKF